MGIFDIFKSPTEPAGIQKEFEGRELEELTKQYGDIYGRAMYSSRFEIGMSVEMIEAPHPVYVMDSNYGATNFKKIIINNSKQKWTYMDDITLVIEDNIIIDVVGDLRIDIKKLLDSKATKMTASDIDAFLKHQNIEEIKKLCEEMYVNGEISRTGNYKYFIIKKEIEKTESEVIDIKSELKDLKEMLDDGLIEQEDYDAKKNELLGL